MNTSIENIVCVHRKECFWTNHGCWCTSSALPSWQQKVSIPECNLRDFDASLKVPIALPLKINLLKNKTTLNLKSASLVGTMLLHKCLTIQSQIKPWLLFHKSFTLILGQAQPIGKVVQIWATLNLLTDIYHKISLRLYTDLVNAYVKKAILVLPATCPLCEAITRRAGGECFSVGGICGKCGVIFCLIHNKWPIRCLKHIKQNVIQL